MTTKKNLLFLFIVFSFSFLTVNAQQDVPMRYGVGNWRNNIYGYSQMRDLQRVTTALFIDVYDDYIKRLFFHSVLEYYNTGKLDKAIKEAGLTGRLDLSGLGIQRLYGLGFVVDKVNNIVTDLDLGENKISKIEAKDFPRSLSRLKKLDLSDNNISYIEPGSFDELKELEYINLNDNPISRQEISREYFTGLPNLKEVYPAPQDEIN